MKKKLLKAELKAARIIAQANANAVIAIINELQDVRKRLVDASHANAAYAKLEAEKLDAYKAAQPGEKTTLRVHAGGEGGCIILDKPFSFIDISKEWKELQMKGRDNRSDLRKELDTLKCKNDGLQKECKHWKERVKQLEDENITKSKIIEEYEKTIEEYKRQLWARDYGCDIDDLPF